MSSVIKTVCAALSIALILAAMVGLHIVSAQSPVDYDADNDGLIEIEWLEQLSAVRWDLNGDGAVDDEINAEAYSAAFPDSAVGMGCAEGCQGYELTRDLNFRSAGSYASGVMNSKWTSGKGWLPISDMGYIFEGNQSSLVNLYIDRNAVNQPEYIGLFGLSGGEIRRVRLLDVNIKGRGNVGAIVGGNAGALSSSFASGNISGVDARVGGLAGVSGGDIASSYTDSNVSGSVAGGLVGYTEGGNITTSHSTGAVTDVDYGGGLVGVNYGSIDSSYATGNVAVDSSGQGEVGGLVGENNGKISSSYATGNVSGYISGGLVGRNQGGSNSSIASSYAVGRVSGQSWAGGLVGFNGSIVTSSYATGSVLGTQATGGLVGYNRGNISSSYSIGKVSGDENTGGFLGVNTDGEMTANYWNTETSGQLVGIGEGSDTSVEGKITEELQEPTGYTAIYADWLADFDNADEDYDETTGVDNVWDFGTSSQYPELKADLDDSGHASWWEFGPQHSRPAPTPTPTPLPTSTPTPTLTPTVNPTPTVTPTPTQTATPTNTPIPTDTPTATPNPTMTPIPTDTPVPTATATHTAEPTDTTVPSNTPEPTKTAVPPTQTPVIIVVTATPSADAPSGGGCNSVSAVPVGAAAANLLFVVAPLGIIGGVRYRRRKKGSDRYE